MLYFISEFRHISIIRKIHPSFEKSWLSFVIFCKNIIIVEAGNLKNENTKSCGCLQKESTGQINLKHGHNRKDKISKTYKSWIDMGQRCTNPKNPAYKNYGGRGITICERWLDKNNGFINFLEDMGECPKGCEIDRINNNLGYCKENCRWVTRYIQSRNKRNNKLFTYKGKIQILKDWAVEYKIKYKTLWMRIYSLKWSIEKALTTPIRKYKDGEKK